MHAPGTRLPLFLMQPSVLCPAVLRTQLRPAVFLGLLQVLPSWCPVCCSLMRWVADASEEEGEALWALA